jgi:hypothetical protein
MYFSMYYYTVVWMFLILFKMLHVLFLVNLLFPFQLDCSCKYFRT